MRRRCVVFEPYVERLPETHLVEVAWPLSGHVSPAGVSGGAPGVPTRMTRIDAKPQNDSAQSSPVRKVMGVNARRAKVVRKNPH